MSSRTYVCFDCRTTERVPTSRISKSCRKCRKPAQHVYHKFSIPPRKDDDGWADLEKRVRPMNLEMHVRALAGLREKRARLERQLETASASSEERRKQMRRQLRTVVSEIKEWQKWATPQ